MLSGYKITVEGQYFVAVGEGKGKSLKRYTFDISLPSMDRALSIIKNKILDVVLPKLYNDYVSYRTHNIINVQPFGNVADARLNIWQMNRTTVESYIVENELPVITKFYPTLMELRNAVDMAERDPDRFQIKQKETEADYKLTKALRELNPDLYALPEERELSDAQKYPVIEKEPVDALEGL